MTKNATFYRMVTVWFFFMLFIPIAFWNIQYSHAQEKAPTPEAPSLLSQAVDEAIRFENENTADFTVRLNRWDASEKAIETEIDAYKVQISAHGNLLLLPSVHLSTLENAQKQNNVALLEVEKRSAELGRYLQTITIWKQQTNDQLLLSNQQLSDLKANQLKDNEKNVLEKKLRGLIKTLSAKSDRLEKIQTTLSETHNQLVSLQTSLLSVSAKFKTQVENKKKENFFARKPSPFKRLSLLQLKSEFDLLRKNIVTFFLPYVGADASAPGSRIDLIALANFFIIYAVLLFFLFRLCSFLKHLQNSASFDAKPYRKALLFLLRKSLIIAGTIFWLYLYELLLRGDQPVPSLELLLNVLIIVLFTRWHLCFLKHISRQHILLRNHVTTSLKMLANFARYFAIAYIVLENVLSSESVVLLVFRIFLELSLLFWVFRFGKIHQKEVASQTPAIASPEIILIKPGVINAAYASIGIGIVLELFGFDTAVRYWYFALGESTVVLLWGGLGFLTLREWGREFNTPQKARVYETGADTFPLKWLLKQICWVMWLMSVIVSSVFIWGGKKTVLVHLVQVLTHPVSIGNMQFSVLHFGYACLILLCTHVLVRFWRFILQDKILSDSPLEAGLKESVATITVYAFWIFGILVSLQAFGIGTTSLAVAFGALGIGLGFGLQNIFNNFISGIILLFERPIQVGDDVEINGVWATVKKINVRSTVVQTYDNASLIIPNADFISAQVINWSFKDKRLRRNIDVGVAYGSDIELVRQTLLEIAAASPKVLQYPKPDVVFKDFGDSALIFRLRVWTTTDIIFMTETAIRFEIDRLFKERNIVIAFPQRDVHVYPADIPSIQSMGTGKSE